MVVETNAPAEDADVMTALVLPAVATLFAVLYPLWVLKGGRGMLHKTFAVVVVAVAAGVGYSGTAAVKKGGYRVTQAINSFKSLYNIPKDELDDFIAAFKTFERSDNTFYEDSEEDYKQVKNYYRVLNRLCSLGSVEKMYIPPVIDPEQDVFNNQILFEQGFADQLNVGEGKSVLEIGCGRGRISHHVATRTGAKVTGINIDPTQLKIAKDYANETGLLGKQLEFVEANMNDRLPFDDASFDAFFQVQAMTYAKDLRSVFGEISRVLKPGARMSVLDGVMLDGYDAKDARHRQLLNETRQVTGFGGLWHYNEWKAAVEDSGFKVIFHADKSVGGHQYPLIMWELRLQERLTWLVEFLVWSGLIPEHFGKLNERFNRHKWSFVEMDQKSMLTTSWHIMAEKL